MPSRAPIPKRGRGSGANPANRFERIGIEAQAEDESAAEYLGISPATEVFVDATKSVITSNDSPDIAVARSLNPYRGCEHGCSYCFARPTHEYLGLSAGLDFETKIFAKPEAPGLLRKELMELSYVPEAIAMSGATDPYQPIERELRISRRCLEVLAEFRHPVCIITKSALVERDLDLLADLARHRAAAVAISLTSLDAKLQRALEPRASTPQARLATMRRLAEAGVPVIALVSPIIPGLNEDEVPALLQAAGEAGAVRAAYALLRLPHGVKEIFADWLEAHAPLRKERVLNTLRQMHGGRLYDSAFGRRLRGSGPRAEQIARLFDLACRRAGISRERLDFNTEAFRRPGPRQLDLF